MRRQERGIRGEWEGREMLTDIEKQQGVAAMMHLSFLNSVSVL
jgi:hypothetical protein